MKNRLPSDVLAGISAVGGITGQISHAIGARMPIKPISTFRTGGSLYRFADGTVSAGP